MQAATALRSVNHDRANYTRPASTAIEVSWKDQSVAFLRVVAGQIANQD
jgi:hypothetical protein